MDCAMDNPGFPPSVASVQGKLDATATDVVPVAVSLRYVHQGSVMVIQEWLMLDP